MALNSDVGLDAAALPAVTQGIDVRIPLPLSTETQTSEFPGSVRQFLDLDVLVEHLALGVMPWNANVPLESFRSRWFSGGFTFSGSV